jgi:hypothetical protein
MAIEITQEQKEQAVEQVTNVIVQPDGWSQAFDDIINADFSGFSTLIAVLVFIILLKPILFLLKYAIAGIIVFMFVKYFLYYAN